MSKKRNVVLYLDAGLVRKTCELGFNLSKTSENYLKLLVNQFSNIYAKNNSGTVFLVARERFELSSAGPKPAMLVRYTTGLRSLSLS